MPPRSPLRWTLAIALAAHLAIAVWAAHVKRPPDVPETPAAPLDVTEAAIDIEPAPAKPTATTAEPPSPFSGASSPHPRATGSSRDRTGPTGTTADAAPIGPVVSAGPNAPDGTWTFDPTGKVPATAGSGPGSLADAIASAMGAGIAPIIKEYVEKRRAFENKHAVLPIYTARDMELGLVPGGVLASITRDEVRRSLAPDNGRALLQFDTDGKGVFASARVLDVSSDQAEWLRVADDILKASHGTTLHLPDGASGIALTIEVTSAMNSRREVASRIVDVRAF